MERLEQSHGESHGVTVQWHSFELRPRSAPPISAEYRAKIEAGRPRVYAVAREHYGLEMNPGPFGFDSRPALIGAKYAESQGVGPAYHAAVMKAYWQEAKVIDDLNVLTDIAAAIGLERDAFGQALREPLYDEQVQADVEQAYAYGINGVPGMVFVDKYLVSGAQPYEVLCQAVDQISSELQND